MQSSLIYMEALAFVRDFIVFMAFVYLFFIVVGGLRSHLCVLRIIIERLLVLTSGGRSISAAL